MSHSSIADLEYFIALARKVGIPFVIDTEGSQIRSDVVRGKAIHLKKGQTITAQAFPIMGDKNAFSLRPGHIIGQLDIGDLLHVGFDSLILCVSDISARSEGRITLRVHESGILESNKGVVVNRSAPKEFDIPPLSEKDHASIDIGLREGAGVIAASFVRSGESVDMVREATKHSMKVISKIECVEALKNVDDIIQRSDMILIDRGDLSKEIPIEKVPFVQKVILKKACDAGKEAFVATNLLETMIKKRNPTLAEVHDVITTVCDGAAGVTLSAETAIGKYPIESAIMMNNILDHAASVLSRYPHNSGNGALIEALERSDYLLH